jgi:hypothetical protein
MNGELARAGLLCEQCDKDPDIKRYRGCLQTPQIGYRDHDKSWVEVEWTPEWQAEWCDEHGIANDNECASRFYAPADLGGAQRHLGDYWTCCPRSIVEFGADKHPRANGLSAIAIGAALDIKRGMPAHLIMGGRQPTAIMHRLIRLALDVLSHLEIEAQRRAIDDAKKG